MRDDWVMLIALVCACGKSHADRRVEATVPPSALANAAPAPVPNATAPPHTTGAWRGTYKSSAGSLYIPPDWKDVHWKVKDTGAGIGEGAIAIQVDPASGRIVGTLEGPLGPAKIDGLGSDGRLTAAIARKDPADEGFTGTIVGTISNDRVEGTMYVSPGEASAIRTATFTMSPEGATTVPR
ncbi:MAG TPA: hypothetical protein VN894_03340 [Polyangiaceae bacterium]|nr:hypothetical protein [Polyangiaceae bacterium]